jgi:hypothetical protein
MRDWCRVSKDQAFFAVRSQRGNPYLIRAKSTPTVTMHKGALYINDKLEAN